MVLQSLHGLSDQEGVVAEKGVLKEKHRPRSFTAWSLTVWAAALKCLECDSVRGV